MPYNQNYRSFNNSRRYGAPRSQPKRPKGKHGQYIDPARFVKSAAALESQDYKHSNEFDDFAIHPLLKSNIATKGYKVPSEIQDKTIPLGLSGQDVVGIANTGTGKTAAFAVPILNRLMHEPASRALIIAPTRELAQQIEQQCQIYAKNSRLKSALVIGGTSINRQIRDLKYNPQIVIGTPGRIKDHIERRTLVLARFNIIVLDEVDRMLDMGFIKDVRLILEQLSPSRQSFFFSATLGPEVSSLIGSFTKNPVTVDVKIGDTAGNVNQDVIKYNGPAERLDRLHDVLIAETMGKALIFCEMKYGAERLSKELVTRGFKSESIHGGKSQGARKRALDNFRENRSNILVATDVAARGIDVTDISHVINFDIPHTYNDYVHRIGRAGRAGRAGQALTFVQST